MKMQFPITLCLAIVLSAGGQSPLLAQSPAVPPPTQTQTPIPTALPRSTYAYPERTVLWEKAVVAFEEKDRSSGAGQTGGIVFIGSSSIVGWTTLAQDFPTLPVINRGFGGSEIQDSAFYAGRLIFPHRPRAVVLYAGDNDIAAGHTNEQVVGDFQTFAKKIHAALPGTKVYFLAIKPSPSRWRFQDRIVEVNKAIAEWIATQTNMGYIDVHTPMLGADGMPRPELYRSDKLHMTPEGYKIWTQAVTPVLK